MKKPLLFAIILSSVSPAFAEGGIQTKCAAFETRPSVFGKTVLYAQDNFPWRVTTLEDGKVLIENTQKKTACSIILASVVSVYLSPGDLVYLRHMAKTRDELVTVDGFSCKKAGSAAASVAALEAAGLCSAPPLAEKKPVATKTPESTAPRVQELKFKPATDRGQVLSPGQTPPATTLEKSKVKE